MAFRIAVAGLRRLDRRLRRIERSLVKDFEATVARRAAPQIGALWRRAMVRTINERTRLHTGTLARSPRIAMRVDASRSPTIRGRASFPATQYETPRERGRPGAAKSGQWAFVVNHHRRIRFIQRSKFRLARSGRAREVIRREALRALIQAGL